MTLIRYIQMITILVPMIDEGALSYPLSIPSSSDPPQSSSPIFAGFEIGVGMLCHFS